LVYRRHNFNLFFIFDEITDRLFVAAFSAYALHSNQKQRQTTIEILFVKLKDFKKGNILLIY